MNVDFQPHLPNEFIQLSPCMLKKKKKKKTQRKKKQWPSLNSNVQVSRQPKCMQFCKLKFWVQECKWKFVRHFFTETDMNHSWQYHLMIQLSCFVCEIFQKTHPFCSLFILTCQNSFQDIMQSFSFSKCTVLEKINSTNIQSGFIKFHFPFISYSKFVFEW